MSRIFLVLTLSLLLGMVTASEGYRILAFFPFPARSHNRVWDPLLKELALQGHQVTALKTFKMEDPPVNNYQEILIKDVLDRVIQMFGSGNSFGRSDVFTRHAMSFFFKSSGLVMGKLWMEDPAVRSVLDSNRTYDAVLFESGFMQEFFTTLQHKFNAVGIEMSTVGNFHWIYWMFGNPVDTSYVVDAGCLDYTDRMTLLQRVHLTAFSLMVRGFWHIYYMPQFQRFMDDNIRYPGWESRPSMLDMMANVSLVLINTDVALTYPHAMSPHFIEVGGINIVPRKPLPNELQELMDGAEDGVIFFTLGSHIQVSSTLGESLRNALSAVFSRLKQKVLWKWETEDFPDIPPNVKISKWFPQQDILAHKNMRLFISHGGFLSVTESIYFGVPMIGIPIMADQDKNIKFVESRGMGIHLALDNLTETSLDWAVQQVLTRPEYKKRALSQSRILRDKPTTPVQRAVYWTEYVIRHRGAPHLRPSVATMPWYQQAMIDVYTAIALIILIPLYIAYKITKCVCCLCKSKSKVKKKNE